MDNSNLPNYFVKFSEDGKRINEPITDPEKIKELQAVQKFVTLSLERIKKDLEMKKKIEALEREINESESKN